MIPTSEWGAAQEPPSPIAAPWIPVPQPRRPQEAFSEPRAHLLLADTGHRTPGGEAQPPRGPAGTAKFSEGGCADLGVMVREPQEADARAMSRMNPLGYNGQWGVRGSGRL